MYDAYLKHIEESFPELLESRCIVACSGGLDSVVLAQLCTAIGLNISLAHCNFQLRGDESSEDERFVKELANRLECNYYLNTFDTDNYAKVNKLSIQMAAREQRYNWFEELISDDEADFILTAHHADDELETFIINLSRGTGIKGLRGIPSAKGYIRRPLLDFSRDEILAYAREHKIDWREDSSNLENYYLRNKIRHNIVPLLKELNPAFLEHFKTTQKNLGDVEKVAQQHIRETKDRLFQSYDNGWKIEVSALKHLSPNRTYLHALFNDYGFSELKNLQDLLTAASGKELVSATHRLIRDRDCLILVPQEPLSPEEYHFKPETGRIKGPVPMLIDIVDDISKGNKDILFVDKETLNHRLEVRKWKKGDYFYPLGMKGRKLVSKFFKDEKYNALEKEDQWLLFSGGELVWIIGKRTDERFKVGPKTTEILRFQLL